MISTTIFKTKCHWWKQLHDIMILWNKLSQYFAIYFKSLQGALYITQVIQKCKIEDENQRLYHITINNKKWEDTYLHKCNPIQNKIDKE